MFGENLQTLATEHGLLCLYALRYSFKATDVAVENTVNYICREWTHIPTELRQRIKREIQHEWQTTRFDVATAEQYERVLRMPT